jgi:hypothetical protein
MFGDDDVLSFIKSGLADSTKLIQESRQGSKEESSFRYKLARILIYNEHVKRPEAFFFALCKTSKFLNSVLLRKIFLELATQSIYFPRSKILLTRWPGYIHSQIQSIFIRLEG